MIFKYFLTNMMIFFYSFLSQIKHTHIDTQTKMDFKKRMWNFLVQPYDNSCFPKISANFGNSDKMCNISKFCDTHMLTPKISGNFGNSKMWFTMILTPKISENFWKSKMCISIVVLHCVSWCYIDANTRKISGNFGNAKMCITMYHMLLHLF